MWGWATNDVDVTPGQHEFRYALAGLPVRPGAYTWRVSLYEDNGKLVDSMDCIPEMIVATEVHQHPYDEWGGLLNIPSEFSILPKEERPT
jgi:hypothetical protein